MAKKKIRTRFFEDQAQRLLREDSGWTTDGLAEELYALRRRPTQEADKIVINWDGTQPAIEIVRTNPNDEPTSPPIVIRNPDGSLTPFPPSGGGGGGGGGGDDDDQDQQPPHPGSGGGSIGPEPPPGPTPGRIFSATLTVKIHQDPPDPGHFDDQQPTFTSTECRPYNPPTINAPTTAFAFPGILKKLDRFIADNHLSGNYTVIVDTVGSPGPPCTP